MPASNKAFEELTVQEPRAERIESHIEPRNDLEMEARQEALQFFSNHSRHLTKQPSKIFRQGEVEI
jgi:hypothetical protein